MSARQIINIEIVYVRLLEEGTDVWRPVAAKRLPDGSFELEEPEGYDPEDEAWEFPPLARVKCTTRRFADGEARLTAVARAD